MYNKDYLAHNSKLLSIDPTEQLIEIQERIKQQIQDIEDRSKVDIAIKIRERQIKSNVTNKLRRRRLIFTF